MYVCGKAEEQHMFISEKSHGMPRHSLIGYARGDDEVVVEEVGLGYRLKSRSIWTFGEMSQSE